MNYICDLCEIMIKSDSAIYKAFDCNLCSRTCRNKVILMNIKKDPHINNYNLWFKSKSPKKKLESTMKRTHSIMDFYRNR